MLGVTHGRVMRSSGDLIPDAEFPRTIHSNDDNDSIRFTTTNGTEVDGERDFPLGSTGEATFDSTPGVFESDGLATVRSFTGNHTRILSDGQSITANGTWFGTGLIEAVWTDEVDIPTCLDASNVTNRSVRRMRRSASLARIRTTTDPIDASIEGSVGMQGRAPLTPAPDCCNVARVPPPAERLVRGNGHIQWNGPILRDTPSQDRWSSGGIRQRSRSRSATCSSTSRMAARSCSRTLWTLR